MYKLGILALTASALAFAADSKADAEKKITESAAIFTEINGNLLNGDGIRSFSTRRAMVDIFAHLQITAAYDALVSARAQIASQRASMTGVQAELTDDLLARIDAATHPYFK